MVGTLLVPHTGNAEACAATGHGRLYLAALDGGINAGSKFYSAPEGESATATIRPTPGDCHGEGASGEYATSDGTAMAGEDYSEEIGSTQFLCADIHPQYCGGAPSEQTVDVFVLHDG
ncbi:MAG: hypothetical protein ACREXJ_11170, partial [Gammaproteobacteria bacterium]